MYFGAIIAFEFIIYLFIFDIMIPLVMHVPKDVMHVPKDPIQGEPDHMRWMYPFERYMKKLEDRLCQK